MQFFLCLHPEGKLFAVVAPVLCSDSCVNIPIAKLFLERGKNPKLQQISLCIHSIKMSFSAFPESGHVLLIEVTHRDSLTGRMCTWMHIRKNQSMGVMCACAFCLYQGFSEMLNEEDELLRTLKT